MKIGAFEPTFGIRMPIVKSVFSAAPRSGAAVVAGASVGAGAVVAGAVVALELSVSLPHEVASSSAAINETNHLLIFISLPPSSGDLLLTSSLRDPIGFTLSSNTRAPLRGAQHPRGTCRYWP